LALWWLLTHRLERFWVPILPMVALLAGIGAMQVVARGQGPVARSPSPQNTSHWPPATSHSPATVFIALLLIFNTCYTFFPNALSAPGKYSRFGFGVEAARLDPMRSASPLILHFNANPPAGKLLLIGDAEVFDYSVPVLYNTCFDDTPFDMLFFDLENETKQGNSIPSLRSSDEILRRLNEAGISFIIVNWSELARFRSPGNYGYTSDLVQLQVFDQLEKLAVLRRVSDIPSLSGQDVFIVCSP
ncbi:MAG: hypothetical protein FWD31_10380, partial [Planctomycetaceae bacterium]|nr:hypothetical protein [Planctomycetaceae bacterium]